MKKINDDSIITRAMIALGCNKRNDLARLLNISPQNLSGYISRGTFINLIEPLLYDKKINVDWIKTGQGSMLAGQPSAIAEPPTNYGASTPPAESLLDLTADVLASDSIFRTALESNVRAFSEAVSMRKEIAVTKARLNQQQREIEELRAELAAIRGQKTDRKIV